MALGTRLKKLRTEAKESLQDVADAVSASKAHIWELEVGRSKNPSVDLISKLADHFHISVAQLVGEDPSDPDADPELLAMFRGLKALSENDRKFIADIIQMKKKKPSE